MKDEAGSQELGARMGGKARSSEQKQEAASRSSLLAPKEGAEMKQDPKQAKNEKADEPSDNSPSTLPASGSKERSPAKFFTDLEVWQKAHAFVLEVYRLTAKLPVEERFGLSSQFRRAAVSISCQYR